MSIIIDISSNIEEKECRICFESTNSEDFISPCFCRGTSKWVHHECLQTWRENSENQEAKIKCMECNYEYNLLPTNIPENIYILKFFIDDNDTIKGKYTTFFIFYLFYCLLSFPLVLEPIEKYDNFVSINMLNYFEPSNKKIFLNFIKNNDFYYTMYFYSLNLNIHNNILYFAFILNLYFNIKNKRVFFYNIFIDFYRNIILLNLAYLFYFLFFYLELNGTYILLNFTMQILNYYTTKKILLKINYIIKDININNCEQRILNYDSSNSSYSSDSSEEILLFENENIILLNENKENNSTF